MAIEKASGIYSPKIINVLNQLLNLQPSLRPDWLGLTSMLEEGTEAKPMMRSASSYKINPQDNQNTTATTEHKQMVDRYIING